MIQYQQYYTQTSGRLSLSCKETLAPTAFQIVIDIDNIYFIKITMLISPFK